MKIKKLNEAFPIYHSGYMDGKDVFSMLIFSGYTEALEQYIEEKNICILNEAILKSFYKELVLQKLCHIPEKRAEEAFGRGSGAHEDFGVYRVIMEHTDWELMAGSFAYDLFSAIDSGKEIYRCSAVQISTGRVVLLDFLEADSVGELARIVRYSAYKLAGLELTGSRPQLECDCMRAVRPPADEWGMIICR